MGMLQPRSVRQLAVGNRRIRKVAQHILNDLPRFREVYNKAILDYRAANGIRSGNHLAPELAEGEAPFWVRTTTWTP